MITKKLSKYFTQKLYLVPFFKLDRWFFC